MAMSEYRGALESRKDFDKTDEGQYRYWATEVAAAETMLREWQTLGTKIVNRFKGGTRATRDAHAPDERGSNFRLNLFHSNVTTLLALLYGNLPKVTVRRRHDDPNDDVGRVAAMIMERMLNNDVQDNGKEYNSVLRAVLEDRLIPGLGCARVRYTFETTPDGNAVAGEDAPVDYYHWRDVIWGWGRTFSEIPWIGFRSYLTKDEVSERFGEEAADKVHLQNQNTVNDNEDEVGDIEEDSPWRKAQVWEIWDKQSRKIIWLSPGYDKILDTKDDTLGLSGFFPCPPFLLANQTTTLYVPVSDFYLAQDLYNEIDVLQTRISIITEAVKVVGVYDRSAEGISRMFKEGTDNDLIPVDNWALFAEKGGIEGQIDWVPIAEISETLLRLRELRDEAIGLLQQVTGMADIMRGQLDGQYEGVGQSQLKAKFGSVRIQALQDEFANFASDLLQIKAEIIARHFEPESIARAANLQNVFDQELIGPAIQLIKNPVEARLRVEIRPESVSMVDYAQLRQERIEYIEAVSGFLNTAGPIMQSEPNAKPFLLRLMQWGLAGFRGSNDIEGVIDKAIQLSEQEGPKDQNQSDEAIKAQAQMQLEQLKHQNAMAQIQAKAQADAQARQVDMEADIATRKAEMEAEMAQVAADMRAKLAEITAKMEADIRVEAMSSEINALQNADEVQGEMLKEGVKTKLEIEKQAHATEQKIKEIKHAEAEKIKTEKVKLQNKPKPTDSKD